MENLEPIEQWEEEERKPSILIKILAAIMVILLLIYFLTSGPIITILSGLLGSSVLHKNLREEVVQIKGIDYAGRLLFINNSYEKLLKIYDNNSGKEFSVCLLGNVQGKDYRIINMYVPEIFFQSEVEVISKPCSNDSLVSMHSHPEKHCLPSEQDVSNFKSFKETNPLGIMAVMCERGRFNFFAG